MADVADKAWACPKDGTAMEPLQTDYTYNASNDVVQMVISTKVGSTTTVRQTTRTCYDTSCTLTGTSARWSHGPSQSLHTWRSVDPAARAHDEPEP